MHSHLRRTIVTAVKLTLGVAILGFLVIKGRDAFSELSAKSIVWPMLAAAMLCTLCTATLSFVRWHILIRALGIDVRLIDTLRLGALGYALNYVSLGSIGGDFFKAIFLAHGQPGRRTEAIATVVADRVMGLLTMLLLASIGILSSGLLNVDSPKLQILCRGILLFAAVGWTGFLLLLSVSALTGPWVRQQALRLRFTGKIVVRLLETVQVYRGQKPSLVAAFGVSIIMALCYVTSFYLVARGLPINEPPWSEHLVIVPVSSLVGAIPMTPSGLGTTEAAFEELYQWMPGSEGIKKGDGSLVAIGRRATDIVVALVGMMFYLTHRREMREVLAEAEELAESGAVE
jgi:glycosyltransferase 2 family protein